MSLASAVVLLQTALSLLTLVNSNPALPQSMRDNATAVAQQAISEAHAALASKATSAVQAAANTPSIQTVSLAPTQSIGHRFEKCTIIFTFGDVLQIFFESVEELKRKIGVREIRARLLL